LNHFINLFWLFFDIINPFLSLHKIISRYWNLQNKNSSSLMGYFCFWRWFYGDSKMDLLYQKIDYTLRTIEIKEILRWIVENFSIKNNFFHSAWIRLKNGFIISKNSQNKLMKWFKQNEKSYSLCWNSRRFIWGFLWIISLICSGYFLI
jgi:hypothetical protein